MRSPKDESLIVQKSHSWQTPLSKTKGTDAELSPTSRFLFFVALWSIDLLRSRPFSQPWEKNCLSCILDGKTRFFFRKFFFPEPHQNYEMFFEAQTSKQDLISP